MNFLNTLPFNFFLYSVKLKEEWVFNQTNEKFTLVQFSSVLSHVQLTANSWTATCQPCLSITNSWRMLKLMSIESWCNPTISSSVIPFSSHLQLFPASGSFPMSQLFPSGGQSIRASASASVLPMNIQGWFPLGWTGWNPLQSKGLSRVPTPQFKSINSLALSFTYGPTLTSIHDYWKPHSFD